ATINRFIADTNADPKPLVWTADPHRPRRCQTRETSVRVGPLDAAGTRARCSIRSASDSSLPAGPQARYKGKTNAGPSAMANDTLINLLAWCKRERERLQMQREMLQSGRFRFLRRTTQISRGTYPTSTLSRLAPIFLS